MTLRISVEKHGNIEIISTFTLIDPRRREKEENVIVPGGEEHIQSVYKKKKPL